MVLLNLVTFKSYYTGPLAKDLNSVDISWIVGAVVTAVVYLLLTRNLDVPRNRWRSRTATGNSTAPSQPPERSRQAAAAARDQRARRAL